MAKSPNEQIAVDLLKRFDPAGARAARMSRPFIIELTGLPKSGKTTIKERMQQMLKRNGYLVAAQEEGAEAIKWAKRIDPEYNLQTGEYALSAAREYAYGSKHKSFHVAILDRAIIDMVVRMEFNRMRGKISAAQQRAIERYALLDVNRRMFDGHVVLMVDPEVALKRERALSSSAKAGETMNNDTLQILCTAHERVWKRLRLERDPSICRINTSDQTPDQTAAEVEHFVLGRFNSHLEAADASLP